MNTMEYFCDHDYKWGNRDYRDLYDWYQYKYRGRDRWLPPEKEEVKEPKPRISNKWKKMNNRGLGQVKRKLQKNINSMDDTISKNLRKIEELKEHNETLCDKITMKRLQVEALTPMMKMNKAKSCPALMKSKKGRGLYSCRLYGGERRALKISAWAVECWECKERNPATRVLADKLKVKKDGRS